MDPFTYNIIRYGFWIFFGLAVVMGLRRHFSQKSAPQQNVAEQWFEDLLGACLLNRIRFVHLTLDPHREAIRAIPYAPLSDEPRDLSGFFTYDDPEPSAADPFPPLAMSERAALLDVLEDWFAESASVAGLADGSDELRPLQPNRREDDVEIYSCFCYRSGKLRVVNIRFTFEETAKDPDKDTPDEMDRSEREPELITNSTEPISTIRVSEWLNAMWDPALGDGRFEIIQIRMPINGSDIRAFVLTGCNDESCCLKHLGTLPASEAEALIEYLHVRLHKKHSYLIGSFKEIIGIKLTNIEVTVHDHRKDGKLPTIRLHVTVLDPRVREKSSDDGDTGCECWPCCCC